MKSQREYIQRASRCPCCDSSNIEGGNVEIDDGGAFQEVECICGFSWVDNYKLIGYGYEQDAEPLDAEQREELRLKIEAEEAERLDPYAEQLTRHLSQEEIQEKRDNAAEGIQQARKAGIYKDAAEPAPFWKGQK